MIKPLKYYFEDGTLTEFNKYTIDTFGVIRNNKGNAIVYYKKKKYNWVGVYNDSEKQRGIGVARAVASTFIGPPPSLAHTAEHIDNKRPDYDALTNIYWLDKSGQRKNQERPEIYKSAFGIIRDVENEKSVKEWVDYLNSRGEKNPFGREYTASMINHYARNKKYGFAYKEYFDLHGEIWKEIVGSKTIRGRWEISNMNRVRRVTTHAENVLSGERLGLMSGYPSIYINGKHRSCHILSFMTFFPNEYAAKKSGEMVLHEDDDKMDFRPHKLRLGTHSVNAVDAHKNGKYEGMKTDKMRCISYIKGIFEKEHDSQHDAELYLKKLGYDKASFTNIGKALSSSEKVIKRYGRTWEKV
jgi:hypothetical protein